MRRIILVFFGGFLLSAAAFAQVPDSVVNSCLTLEAIDDSVVYERLDDGVGELSDDALPGYMTLTYEHDGVAYSYAKKHRGLNDLLMLGSRKVEIQKARRLGNEKPMRFDATKSMFGLVHYRGHEYFCLTSNFEGLGRSGSFQNIRAAYLVPLSKLSPMERAGGAYYVVRDVRNLK